MEPDPHALRLRVRQYGTETPVASPVAGVRGLRSTDGETSEFKTGRSLIYTGWVPPISWTDDAGAAQRSAAIRPFPKHSAYRVRELWGTLRLTWCGLLPLMGKLQLAVRKYAGTEDAMDALFRLDTRCRALEAENQSLRDILDADQAEYAENRTEDQQRFPRLTPT